MYHNTEQEIRGLPGGKTIRLDSYLVESCGRLFDVEMQVGRCPAFAKRLRGYQSIMDAGTLKRGDDYDLLKESYLVFICTEDPFGAGLPVYTLERTCMKLLRWQLETTRIGSRSMRLPTIRSRTTTDCVRC